MGRHRRHGARRHGRSVRLGEVFRRHLALHRKMKLFDANPNDGPGAPAETFSMAELEEQYIAERKFYREHLVHDPKRDVLHLLFACDYEVPLGEITEPLHLLRWVAHLAEKNWMEATLIRELTQEGSRDQGGFENRAGVCFG